MATSAKKLGYYAGGWKQSKTTKYMDCFDPSTGEVIALAPQCTAAEVEDAVLAAKAAFPAWADTPPNKRVQVLFRMKALMDKHLDELTLLLAKENGKVLDEAMGDVLKVTEVVAIEVPDHPGGLSDVLGLFEGSIINIEYMYAFPFVRGGKAVLIFRFDQPDSAIETLRAGGITVLDRDALDNR